MPQLLLFPDPRPLVERLGRDFFRQAPESPGVYLMRDATDAILYVGKARNLRKRLNSYRVANPERLRRRQLRLLRAVARIELQECASEAAALAKEASLLRSLRPRFNRAGTWPSPLRFLGWCITETGMELRVAQSSSPGWVVHGPFTAAVIPLRASLLRMLWCAIHPEEGLAGLPSGWFSGHFPQPAQIRLGGVSRSILESAEACLHTFFAGQADTLLGWVRDRTTRFDHPFEATVREADLETIEGFANQYLLQTQPEIAVAR